jgi:hypothetical protein
VSESEKLEFHLRHARLKPPLAPNDEVVAAYADAIKGHAQRVLVLGITPDLLSVAETSVTVDISKRNIAHIWPGDTPTRKVIQGNWLDAPLQAQDFTAVIGDGGLTGVLMADYTKLFVHLEHVLLPGARIAFRIYETPEPGETIAHVRHDTMAGKIPGVHAFKWRLAMAIAAETKTPSVPVALIHRMFEREFPDRAALIAATGWSVEDIREIDAYAGQKPTYAFPTRRELLATLPPSFAHPRFLPSGTYELAERCPIFVADFAP